MTTIALARAARYHLSPGDRVLDMGAGSSAILALYAAKLGCAVTASERNDAIALQAEASIAANGADITLRRGTYFAGSEAPLDWVIFNPPYVPTATGHARGLPEDLRTQWDGGPDGTSAMRGLLEALAERRDRPRVLMGVNRRHVPREAVERLLVAQEGVFLDAVESSILGVDVYVFSMRKSPIASASSPQA